MHSPFERNVVQHYHTQEHVLDFVFRSLGLSEDHVAHPVFLTEAICSPIYCREKMLQLLFECYKVPKVSFGIDSLLSFAYNCPMEKDGLVISVGHQASHIVPVLGGEMQEFHVRRLNLGGFHMVESLLRVLQTRYFYNRGAFTWPLAQEIMHQHCYTALDYFQELERLRTGNQVKIQLPFVQPQQPTKEELEKKRQSRREQGERLRQALTKKREEKFNQLRLELEEIAHIEDLRQCSSSEFTEALSAKNLGSWDEVLRRKEHLTLQLKVKEPVTEDRFNLVDIPNDQLTAEQIHEKRGQKMQRAAFLMRQSKKQEREQLEKLRTDNPDAFLLDLHSKRAALVSKIEARRKQKEGSQGRQRNQRRSKIMAELGDENEEDDTFGMNEEDWQVYREIQKDYANEEEEDQTALAELDVEIAKIDPSHVVENTLVWRPPTKEDYQVYLEVDRVRPVEVLFQPCLIGHEQEGLGQMLAHVFALFPAQQSQRMAQNIFVTGGAASSFGFEQRIAKEVLSIRPFESMFSVRKAKDLIMDAWKGASLYCATPEAAQSWVTREEFLECGEWYLTSKHQTRYSNVYRRQPKRQESGEEMNKRAKVDKAALS